MSEELAGRVAVISGASGGIGAAAAQRLATLGCKIVAGYNSNRETAEKLIAGLPGTGHAALRIPLEDSAALATLARDVEARYGRLDILLNTAGFTRAIAHTDLNALDDALFDRIFVTNVRGPYAIVRALAPLLKRTGDAVIINVSSISAFTGTGSNIAYGASKAALDIMSQSLARVLAPEIRVLVISPGGVDTAFVPGRTREALEKNAAPTPMKKVTSADDVAKSIEACVTHLTSSTGAVIVVDGGRLLVR